MEASMLRHLEPTDAADWLRLRIRAVREHPTAFLMSEEEEAARNAEDIAKQWSAPRDRSFILGAFESDHLVGSVGVARPTQRKLAHNATLWGMYVAPEHRRGGLGRKLLEAAIAGAVARSGVERLFLSVDAQSDGARKLYEAQGFVLWGREPDAFRTAGRSVDEDHMVLRLL